MLLLPPPLDKCCSAQQQRRAHDAQLSYWSHLNVFEVRTQSAASSHYTRYRLRLVWLMFTKRLSALFCIVRANKRTFARHICVARSHWCNCFSQMCVCVYHGCALCVTQRGEDNNIKTAPSRAKRRAHSVALHTL